MEITRTRTLRFRMGEYESFETGATVRREFPDDADPDTVATEMNELLAAALSDDLQDVAAITGDRKSFIHKIITA